MSQESLDKAIKEAKYLSLKHSVEVSDIPDDEIAMLPKRADK